MYFSLVPTPGYNPSYLETCGVEGEWGLFAGWWNDTVWAWGGKCSPEDILAEAKLDVLEVFESADLKYEYDNALDQEDQWVFLPFTNMTEMKMMIDSRRPRYPSDKLTFTIANITRGTIRFVNIFFKSNAEFDVDVVLEDSKRNFLNSFLFLLSFKH